MSNGRFAACVVSLLAAAGSVVAVAQTGREANRTIYGAGTNSCSVWTEARQDERWFTSGQWILGFVSAANQYSKVPPTKTDARTVASWVDDYCYQHATSDLADAARELVDHMVAGTYP
ncbi:MAG: hypothetical protein GEU82_09310 [Luteitalea sp.]|nr:hypothetical protein [Luteitalea sp.]